MKIGKSEQKAAFSGVAVLQKLSTLKACNLKFAAFRLRAVAHSQDLSSLWDVLTHELMWGPALNCGQPGGRCQYRTQQTIQ